MKKITFLTVLLFSVIGFSQSNRQLIQNYLDNNRVKLNLTAQDVSDWIIESEVPGSGTGITSTYIVQRYAGIEIFNAQSNVWVKNGSVLNIGNNFKRNIAQKFNTTTPSLTAVQALTSAYAKLDINNPSFSVVETINNNSFKLSDGLQEDVISAKLVFQTQREKLQLAWAFQFYSPDGKHLWDVRIDALNGAILEKHDLTISCHFDKPENVYENKKNFSFENIVLNKKNAPMTAATPATYRVIPFNYDSPNHHPFELITTAGDPVASPNGWHNANSLTGTNAALIFNYTRGNNVLAQEDADGNNGTGIRPDGTAALMFDFTYTGQTTVPTAYTSASTTNLFYMNNIMHDVWYQYGFNEASGNFQQNNYGKGGTVSATGDYVQADSQDGYAQTTPTNDNANFSTPNDGQRPRMQMFMWTTGAPPTEYIQINSPSAIAGPRTATTNVFDTTDRIPVPTSPNGITSDLILYTNDPVNVGQNPNSACAAATNPFDLSGKIALIKRGGCFFSVKVKNAQDAGATAVIMMDSIPNNPQRLSMSSSGVLGITIPAVFVTKEIGDEMIAEMANGPVNITLQVPDNLYLYADGSLENGIVAHEFGHGISNKLIGGFANSSCMTNYEQMGEGWSDWFSIMMQLKSGDVGTTPIEVGTYAINQPTTGFGLRSFPYTTDMALNPRTFAGSNSPIPTVATDTGYRYVVGEFWTSVMWDLTWAYIEKYGFDPDAYFGTGGNNKVMRLALDALKLQACNTASVVSARDNLFAADQATTGGSDFCLIANVFANRGVGMSASSGDANDCSDQVESFDTFPIGPNCNLTTNYLEKNDLFRIFPNPAKGNINLRINNYVGKVAIEFVDINGRIVKTIYDNNFSIQKTVNINELQAGVYVIKIVGENINYTQKVVLN